MNLIVAVSHPMDNVTSHSAHPGATSQPELSPERLLLEIERLRQELDEVKREKSDLEILLETTTEHGDTIEAQLHNQAESAVRDGEKRLAQFLEAVPVGVFVVDVLGRPYYANQMAQQILGKGIVAQATALALPEIYQAYIAGTEQLYPAERQPIVQALRGKPTTVDDIEIRQGNKTIPLEMWATPIFNEKGKIVYAISAFQDITQRKHAEAEGICFTQELEAKNAALQEIDKLKDEFLANTSHELRTPLHSIIGLAESLIEGATGLLPATTVANLEMIVSSGRRLAALVNDILDFAKLKHHNIELQLQPVGMREITDVVLRLSQPLIDRKSLQLINQINPNLPPVHADENRLQQILHNLVSNAIKFTEKGQVEVSASLVMGNGFTL
ncbi:MAG TPA: PAS fold family protein, partial [Cyanobacteria bacterium UBA8803]|nr:PAS fold family protein [Cyanobacteria bacterium UBA9273]HBL59953.1 PAS fold family protein [Cyanobacteria bacterium UBA8803]